MELLYQLNIITLKHVLMYRNNMEGQSFLAKYFWNVPELFFDSIEIMIAFG